MTRKSLKVIFDTNVWISFLIGKRLGIIKQYLSAGSISIVMTEQLITELKIVTSRDKLKKYFPKESVSELIELLKIISQTFEIQPTHFDSRDPKDNFLLDLIDSSQADYLVTGDKGLLELNPFKTAQIVSVSEFEKQIKKMRVNE
ncbi:putative toxin-antitoxin system toxin component, PIN family [Cytophagales bacterium LB-30]|uniref:Toxin-antitoxin system toxin component, PIN family n=1 Tax=Shiella aurantiaca TaxID=3058365 RepID=A0ABT8F8Z2_9BACT|nr:putative toxin-antitoxin system toxin component, PIN family [Shiella aurantiaca]MDN4166431.1 putative toxin-antitoxin system toxin component, PIN family [Shiella aurantiaca]